MKIDKKFTIFILVLVLIISIFLGIILGSVAIPFTNIMDCLFGKDTTSTYYILITNVRLPRVISGLVAGVGLSVSGVVLQSVMNNSLASPNTIGVNSGAGFAAMLAMIFFPASTNMLSIFSFLGAFFTTIIIFLLAYLADSSRMTIILAGITVSSFLNAGISTVKLLNTDVTINITSFMAGSLSGLTFSKILVPSIGILVSLVIVIFLSTAMNLINLGDDVARSLGLNVGLCRFLLLLLSSILAGGVVSFAGMIGFVGLVIPHICRQLFGNDARFLIPCSALLGASFVVICDILGRVLFAPYELPVGIITSFIGGPFFLYLLLRKKGGRRINA